MNKCAVELYLQNCAIVVQDCHTLQVRLFVHNERHRLYFAIHFPSIDGNCQTLANRWLTSLPLVPKCQHAESLLFPAPRSTPSVIPTFCLLSARRSVDFSFPTFVVAATTAYIVLPTADQSSLSRRLLHSATCLSMTLNAETSQAEIRADLCRQISLP